MERLKQSHTVEVIWHSFELRPPESLPVSPEYRDKILAMRPRFEQMAREQYGIEVVNPGPFGINSRPALIGAKYAEAQGLGDAYLDEVMKAYWHQALSLAETEVLLDVAQKIGLNQDAFLAALDQEEYYQAVVADVEQAMLYGLNSVPSLIFQKKYLVNGAQPYEVLVNIIDQIEAEESKAS